MQAMFLAGPLELLLILSGFGVGAPTGIPPAPEDPVMSKLAPEECLFYTTWSGVAEADPNSPNQTEQLMAEPEVRLFMQRVTDEIVKAIRRQSGSPGGPAEALVGDGVRWGRQLLGNAGALFVSRANVGAGGVEVDAGLVLRAGDQAKELETWLLDVQRNFLPENSDQTDVDDDAWHHVRVPQPGFPPIAWGVKGPYLLVGVGEGAVERIVERARTEPPGWLQDLRKQLPVERIGGVSYLNVKQLVRSVAPLARSAGGPPLPTILEALGLDDVQAVGSVAGLDGKTFISRTLVMLEGEPRGLLAFAAAPPLSAADLAIVPRDATFAVALRLDAAATMETAMGAVAQISPDAREEMEEGLGEMRRELGFDPQTDLLAPLGDRWLVYSAPSEGGLVVTGATAVVSVRDHARAVATQEKLLAKVREMSGRSPRAPRIEEFEAAGHKAYFFNALDDDFVVAPAWCLTEDELIVALFPQNIKAYLSRGSDFESIADVPEVAKVLSNGGGPVALSYVDTRQVFDLVYPIMPFVAQMMSEDLNREGFDLNTAILPSAPAIRKHLRPSVQVIRRHPAGIEFVSRQTLPGGGGVLTVAPLLAGVSLPAVTSARSSARRVQSMNNLKQITLALHMYQNDHRDFPPAYTADKEGKPLLSWRVMILPYIEQQQLYDEFHLDEPWDSQHNQKLLSRMPQIYSCPGRDAGPPKTHYLTVRGEDTVFPGAESVGLRDISDGSANTIMVVEADNARTVPWSAPEDYAYDKNNPAQGLGGMRRGGFLAAFADGSVQMIPPSIDPEMLLRLFQRSDGERIDRSGF